MKRIVVSLLAVIVILTQGLLQSISLADQSNSEGTTPDISSTSESVPSLTGERYEVALITGDVVIVISGVVTAVVLNCCLSCCSPI